MKSFGAFMLSILLTIVYYVLLFLIVFCSFGIAVKLFSWLCSLGKGEQERKEDLKQGTVHMREGKDFTRA